MDKLLAPFQSKTPKPESTTSPPTLSQSELAQAGMNPMSMMGMGLSSPPRVSARSPPKAASRPAPVKRRRASMYSSNILDDFAKDSTYHSYYVQTRERWSEGPRAATGLGARLRSGSGSRSGLRSSSLSHSSPRSRSRSHSDSKRYPAPTHHQLIPTTPLNPVAIPCTPLRNNYIDMVASARTGGRSPKQAQTHSSIEETLFPKSMTQIEEDRKRSRLRLAAAQQSRLSPTRMSKRTGA
ncbi:hypothetical protein BDW02DRAFT_596763 [Decorospora gaudefroyi]|uniref:Uncharacterized protein n=1 Tax=Decorospora gaudefroyi TaxID=184978 RepID=A0A6A5KK84_9PLEO|nr:hypothetical protein BDW02DRAFT_596763 [Decorospora gaudefroyi]